MAGDPRLGSSLYRAALAAALVLAAAPAAAQTGPAQPDYHPSLGDIMTMAVQPRHIKLGLAGKARNWAYVTYESSELRNAFNRVARTVPTYRNEDLAKMFAANEKEPLDQLDAAIKTRNGPAFDVAYAKVTQACNACHRGLEHSFVVIKEPAGAAFADQSFAATPPGKAK